MPPKATWPPAGGGLFSSGELTGVSSGGQTPYRACATRFHGSEVVRCRRCGACKWRMLRAARTTRSELKSLPARLFGIRTQAKSRRPWRERSSLTATASRRRVARRSSPHWRRAARRRRDTFLCHRCLQRKRADASPGRAADCKSTSTSAKLMLVLRFFGPIRRRTSVCHRDFRTAFSDGFLRPRPTAVAVEAAPR